jgi:hypothetical protein
MSEPEEFKQHHGERLEQKAGEMFSTLQHVYAAMTHKEPLEEEFRIRVRDLLNSIDHVNRK